MFQESIWFGVDELMSKERGMLQESIWFGVDV